MSRNQDNGLFSFDIGPEPATPKKRGPKPKNNPIDQPDPGIVPANINKLDDIDIVNDSSMN